MNTTDLLFYVGTGLLFIGFFTGVIQQFLKNKTAKNVVFYISAISLISSMGVYIAREVMNKKSSSNVEAVQAIEVLPESKEVSPVESK